LTGRVWSSGQPAWVADLTQDGNFPRAPFAEKGGLRGGVCFPIKLGDEMLGVLECFGRRVRELDSEFLDMLANVGSQLGQFMEHTAAEEALRQHHERIHLMLGTALDAIITIDGQGFVTDWNPQAESNCSGQPRMDANAREWSTWVIRPTTGILLLIRVYSRQLAVFHLSSYGRKNVRLDQNGSAGSETH
jgi:PAS domain-containing protein